MNPTPMIITLAGPSAGGKSALAQCLAPRLESPASPVLGLDSFYDDLAHLPIAERSQVNFDHPDSMDWPLMESVLDSIVTRLTKSVHCAILSQRITSTGVFLGNSGTSQARYFRPSLEKA